jgi:hypothetical protein
MQIWKLSGVEQAMIPNDVSVNGQEITPGALCPKKSHD